MSRWDADPRGRLQRAALDLFGEHGYEQTTVADIARRAGVTPRTFFRHFSDKREVLFEGEATLHELLVLAVAGAINPVSPLDGFTAALKPATAMFYANRPIEQVLRRHAVIAANEELLERELVKLSRLAASLAEAFVRHGIPRPTAELVAEAGVLILKIAVRRWVDEADTRDLDHHIDRVTAELAALTVTG
ncbi:TetR/AcrR family transcriptional regulator [Nocardia takedensis]|uniref:TetR/AcrR family transcriptional regulator n=1 Tax=Nocardia takedensis TaxID=259390 RepID=UPI000315136F|nr:TetR/AcrR family transcriptional regulator [Nocardia takedensis]